MILPIDAFLKAEVVGEAPLLDEEYRTPFLLATEYGQERRKPVVCAVSAIREGFRKALPHIGPIRGGQVNMRYRSVLRFFIAIAIRKA